MDRSHFVEIRCTSTSAAATLNDDLDVLIGLETRYRLLGQGFLIIEPVVHLRERALVKVLTDIHD